MYTLLPNGHLTQENDDFQWIESLWRSCHNFNAWPILRGISTKTIRNSFPFPLLTCKYKTMRHPL